MIALLRVDWEALTLQLHIKVYEVLKPLTLAEWKRLKPGGIIVHGRPGTGKTTLGLEIIKRLTGHDQTRELFVGVAAKLEGRHLMELERRLSTMKESAIRAPDDLHFVFIDDVHSLASLKSSAGPLAG